MIDRQRLVLNGGVDWSRRYTLCSDLNSQPKRSGDIDPFDPESCVRVTCNVGYLCANFGLPRPLCSRLRPDVRDRRQTDRHRDRQTDVRQHHRLMPRLLGAGA